MKKYKVKVTECIHMTSKILIMSSTKFDFMKKDIYKKQLPLIFEKIDEIEK